MRTATCTVRTATTIEARQRTGMRRLLPGPGAARQGPLLLALLFLLIGSLAHAEAPGPARVRELLDHRCVVCHACYDAPCQLKLGAWDGLLRGASKQLVYDGTRLKEAAPTRLFIDAQTPAQWRQKGFFSVLDGADGTAANDASDSGVLHRMLALKEHNPLPETALLPGDVDVSINRAQSCPTPQEFDRFAQQHPQWGMPFGLPGLPPDEITVLQDWLGAGAPAAPPPALSAAQQRQVREWEHFLNGDSVKEQLVSRYLYEHLFMAHLHFDQGPGQPYFQLLRSATPPGQAIVPVATRRPTDDPRLPRVYYRLAPERETIVDKTHLPYALNAARMAHWRELFFGDDYRVAQLPGYARDVANNPFAVFQAIPAAKRYRFMLDDAGFFIMGFIKGPVCRGQVALNVIEDQFWVFFENDGLVGDNSALDDLLREQSHNLHLPAEQSSQADVLQPWLRYALQEQDYLKAQSAYLARRLAAGRRLNLDLVWNGEGRNPNAALTVFRHFDNASVVQGLVGAPPKTAWLISYPLFERIHYLLVAGFDVFGNVGHQLLTRMYMDFLRMEGEFNFVTLLPRTQREATLQHWYRGATPQEWLYLQASRVDFLPDAALPYAPGPAQPQLYGALRQHLAPVLSRRFELASVADAGLRRSLERLAALQGAALDWLPELSYLRVDDGPRAPQYFTLLRNTGHSNVSQLLAERLALLPQEDTLTVVPGFIGAYPNALYHAKLSELDRFVSAVAGLASEQDYSALASRFAMRRTDSGFWPFSDALQRAHLQDAPGEAGLLDYNRLENR